LSGSQRRHSVPTVARILGISERGVRDKIARGQLDAVKEGKRWMVLLPPEQLPTPPEDDAVVSGSSRGSGAVVDAVVTPAQIERAIERTGQRYVTDMAALYDRVSTELGAVYEGQLAAKDQTIGTQAEMIAELRRRAERAEAERNRLTAAQDVPAAPGTPEDPTPGNPSGAASAGFWARVRRVCGGERG